ncbi:MAG: DUF2092 domain-containing protein [Steroidobacteraceae bacterium]
MRSQNLRSAAVALIAVATLTIAGAASVRAADAAAAGATPSASGNLAPAIELEPKALGILKGACDKLAASKTMSFKAVVSEESPSRLGPPLAYYTTSEVLLERPDKLRVVSPGDGPRSEFYYDGKTMVAYSPAENMVARAPAPATIDAMLEAAFKAAQIYFPYTDLLVTDPYKGLSDGLRIAFYVGQSDSVGGVKTHIIAYANDHAFVQAWIGVDDRMPRRLQAVFRSDPLQLRHSVNLSDWKLGAAVPAGAFTPPEKSTKALPIAFGSPQAMPAGDRSSGAKQQ